MLMRNPDPDHSERDDNRAIGACVDLGRRCRSPRGGWSRAPSSTGPGLTPLALVDRMLLDAIDMARRERAGSGWRPGLW